MVWFATQTMLEQCLSAADNRIDGLQTRVVQNIRNNTVTQPNLHPICFIHFYVKTTLLPTKMALQICEAIICGGELS